MLEVTKEKAIQLLIEECLKTGRYYLCCECRISGEVWLVELYYHRNYAKTWRFTDELAYELFLSKLSKHRLGYSDYRKFAKENDYDLEARLESFRAAALT
jgi:hypothetical protein